MNSNKSFFEVFSVEEIFNKYTSCKTLIELAKKLGYKKDHLTKLDYQFINKIKDRKVWKKYVKKGSFEQDQKSYVKNLIAEELIASMNSSGITTVSHLATHYLMSQRHGRDILKERIIQLDLEPYVPDELYKGFFGTSRTPWNYPTKQYEKQQGPKPLVCRYCGFEAKDPKQLEIHHLLKTLKRGEKLSSKKEYVTTKDLEVMCANCHTLQHRIGEKLMEECGLWRRKPPIQLSYENPDDIFFDDCPFDYRVQKKYYIRWHLRTKDQYKCYKCSVVRWGPEKKILVLELNHINGTRKDSSLNNLELLCPNCHRLCHTTANKGQPVSTTEKPPLKRVYIKVTSND